MGNIQLNRNKDFQSVAPFPINNEPSGSKSKRKKSMSNKTAPSPEKNFAGASDLAFVNSLMPNVDIESSQTPQKVVSELKASEFDFKQTESQLRRKGLADCEFECSQITNYLFVGGAHVAVENHFVNDPTMTYLGINMYDGRMDDICWFVCDVIQFIMKARSQNEKVLIHCEKGVSRSCSFAIAYRMWSTGEKWKTAFEYVKKCRAVCAPNTAFTCNLIEIGEILAKEIVTRDLLFRVAFHLPHDPLTAVLKLCRNPETRKIIKPDMSLLDPKGVFVIRAANHDTNNQQVFIWRGSQASAATAEKAIVLCTNMYGIVTNTQDICEIFEGRETEEFINYMQNVGAFGVSTVSAKDQNLPAPVYDDLYDNRPSMEVALAAQREHEQLRLSRERPQAVRESSIRGFEDFGRRDMSSSREVSIRDMDISSGSSSNGPGKLSRIPSLKMATAGPDSRRSSHSKISLPITTSAESTKTKLNIGGNDEHNVVTRSVNIASISNSQESHDERKVSRLDLSVVSNPPASAASQLGVLPQLDESPAASSRRDSNGSNDMVNIVPLVLTSRATSLKLPPLSETESQPGGESVKVVETSPSRRNLIDKINEVIATEVLSTVPSKSSSSISSQLIPKVQVPPLVPSLAYVNNDYEDISGSTRRRTSDATMKDEGDLRVAESSASSVTVEKNGKGGDNTSEAQSLLRTPSKSRILSFVTGVSSNASNAVNPEHRQQHSESSVEGSGGLFRNNSRIMPHINSMAENVDEKDNSCRKLSDTTDSTQTLSRIASPNSMTRDESRKGLSLSNTPPSSSLEGISSRPGSRSAQLKLSLATPQKLVPSGGVSTLLLQRTPSTDCHPDNVGLARGPTPAEDLLLTGSSRRNSNSGREASLSATTPVDKSLLKSAAALNKPVLYQVVEKENRKVSRSSRKDSPYTYEWQAMGVYDDEDLTEDSMLLLLCPTKPHYLWFGSQYNFKRVGVDSSVSNDILRWIANVRSGDVGFENMVGKNLNSNTVECVRSGEESDSFWTAFNDGY